MKKYNIHTNKIVKVPTSYENIVFGYDTEFTEQHANDGFLEIIEPTLNENQQIDYNIKNGVIDTEKGTFTYDVTDIPKPTARELQAQKKQERNQKLTDGIIVNNIWFNEDKLTQFTVMAQMIASIGQSSFEWGFEDGFKQITVQDAIATVMQASAQFQQIYKDYV